MPALRTVETILSLSLLVSLQVAVIVRILLGKAYSYRISYTRTGKRTKLDASRSQRPYKFSYSYLYSYLHLYAYEYGRHQRASLLSLIHA